MRTVRLGRTGIEVSAVGFGTWPFTGPSEIEGQAEGWSGHDDELAARALIRAYELGITHWDTADAYGAGRAERLIGSGLNVISRQSIFLASKVGWERGPYDHYYHPAQMRRQLEATLRNLGTDWIDLYYLHHCDFGRQNEHLDTAIEMMRIFRDEGKIRFIGLSDWNSQRIISYIERVNPDVVQANRNVLEDTYESSGLKELVEERDLGVVFFSPLKHGLLLGKFEKPVIFGKGDMRDRIPLFQDQRFLSRMRQNRSALCKRFHDHPQPVLHGLLGALWKNAAHASVLVGLRNPEQVEAVACVDDLLSSEDAGWISGLYNLPVSNAFL